MSVGTGMGFQLGMPTTNGYYALKQAIEKRYLEFKHYSIKIQACCENELQI
jgi:hypothetical protein